MSVTLLPQGIGTLAYPAYVGFSGDIKPLPTVDDATFHELDTRRRFAWKAGEWHLLDQPEPAVDYSGVLSELLSELRKIRSGLEHVVQTQLPDPGE